MKKTLKYLAIMLAVILADQITKDYLLHLVAGRVPLSAPAFDLVPYSWVIARVTNFFNIVFTWNTGTSFSLFRHLGAAAPWIVAMATGAIIGFLGVYLFRRAARFEGVPLALILGGALGNLVDRIRFGAVIDFLDFHIGGAHYPSFNVADICICTGVALYILNWWLTRRKCLTAQKGEK